MLDRKTVVFEMDDLRSHLKHFIDAFKSAGASVQSLDNFLNVDANRTVAILTYQKGLLDELAKFQEQLQKFKDYTIKKVEKVKTAYFQKLAKLKSSTMELKTSFSELEVKSNLPLKEKLQQFSNYKESLLSFKQKMDNLSSEFSKVAKKLPPSTEKTALKTLSVIDHEKYQNMFSALMKK